MFSNHYKPARAYKAFTVPDASFYIYMPLPSICIIKEHKSCKACPLNTLAHPGCESRPRPNMLGRLIAVVIHIKSFIRAFHDLTP